MKNEPKGNESETVLQPELCFECMGIGKDGDNLSCDSVQQRRTKGKRV